LIEYLSQRDDNYGVNITKEDSGIIVLTFPYNPLVVAQVKNVPGRKWHPFLQTQLSPSVISRRKSGGESSYTLELLRRKLLSRKYSYKTVKAYIYFNIDFLNFIHKKPLEITDNDIKDYLVYLSEKKEASIYTLNQVINALKFCYGTMLKKKFIYKVKKPRKDKKLPVVLSKEEIAKDP